MLPVRVSIMKWAKRFGVVIAALLAALVVLPFVFSVDDYRARIEKEISSLLKEPVTITRLRAFALPTPHVTAEGISIGKTGDVKVSKLTITPDLWSLLGDTKVIRHIGLSGVQITQNGIDRLAVLGKSDSKVPARTAVRVGRITLEDATLQLGLGAFGPLEAVVEMNARSEPEQISIATRDGKFKAEVKPDKGKFIIEVLAKAWRLPLGAPVTFDELKINGIATLNDLTVGNLQAKLYGGSVAGSARLSWTKGVQLRGAFEVKQLDIAPLTLLFSPNTRVSGRLNGKPVVSANAPAMAHLGAALRVETPFQVHNGVLRGVDIRKAATNFLMKDSSGETRFDQLSGYLVTERGTHRFSSLKVVSGALSADGNVTIAANKALSGRINAQVSAASVAAATVPLNVSGTLDAPTLLPTGAALAGAAVGTAILGPTIGTSVGAKVGNWAEGLFGSKK